MKRNMRQKNIALGLILCALVVIFYGISMIRI